MTPDYLEERQRALGRRVYDFGRANRKLLDGVTEKLLDNQLLDLDMINSLVMTKNSSVLAADAVLFRDLHEMRTELMKEKQLADFEARLDLPEPSIKVDVPGFRKMVADFTKALPNANEASAENGFKCLALAYLGLDLKEGSADQIMTVSAFMWASRQHEARLREIWYG